MAGKKTCGTCSHLWPAEEEGLFYCRLHDSYEQPDTEACDQWTDDPKFRPRLCPHCGKPVCAIGDETE